MNTKINPYQILYMQTYNNINCINIRYYLTNHIIYIYSFYNPSKLLFSNMINLIIDLIIKILSLLQNGYPSRPFGFRVDIRVVEIDKGLPRNHCRIFREMIFRCDSITVCWYDRIVPNRISRVQIGVFMIRMRNFFFGDLSELCWFFGRNQIFAMYSLCEINFVTIKKF